MADYDPRTRVGGELADPAERTHDQTPFHRLVALIRRAKRKASVPADVTDWWYSDQLAHQAMTILGIPEAEHLTFDPTAGHTWDGAVDRAFKQGQSAGRHEADALHGQGRTFLVIPNGVDYTPPAGTYVSRIEPVDGGSRKLTLDPDRDQQAYDYAATTISPEFARALAPNHPDQEAGHRMNAADDAIEHVKARKAAERLADTARASAEGKTGEEHRDSTGHAVLLAADGADECRDCPWLAISDQPRPSKPATSAEVIMSSQEWLAARFDQIEEMVASQRQDDIAQQQAISNAYDQGHERGLQQGDADRAQTIDLVSNGLRGNEAATEAGWEAAKMMGAETPYSVVGGIINAAIPHLAGAYIAAPERELATDAEMNAPISDQARQNVLNALASAHPPVHTLEATSGPTEYEVRRDALSMAVMQSRLTPISRPNLVRLLEDAEFFRDKLINYPTISPAEADQAIDDQAAADLDNPPY